MNLTSLVRTLDRLNEHQIEDQLSDLLTEFNAAPRELAHYTRFSSEKYTRNYIAKSEHYELLALCWQSGQVSPIHDHAGSMCGVRVITGVATEIRFERTPNGCLIPTDSTTYSPGEITVSRDSDLHLVANVCSKFQPLVTLHLYSPPLQGMATYPIHDTVFGSLIPDNSWATRQVANG